MTDRSADSRSDRRKERRSKKRDATSGFTIWVPPGGTPVTSNGVQVVTIGNGKREEEPRDRLGERADRVADRRTDDRVADRRPDDRVADRRPDDRRERPSRRRSGRYDWILDDVEENGWRQTAVRRPKRRELPPESKWRPPAGGRAPSSAGWAPSRGAKFTQPDLGWTISNAPGPERRGWDVPLGVAQAPLGGDAWVPPEIEAMAQTVMAQYDMKVSAMHMITTKPDKGGAIWKIDTNRGPRSLKLLHREPDRSLFSVGAQDYLVKKGARVPPLVRSKHGLPYHEIDGRMWIVTDWVEGLTPAVKVDLAGAQQLCYGLGEFHRLSKGYIPPAGARFSSRLHRWPKVYRKVLTKIGWFRQIAEAFREQPASATLLSMVDMFEQQARDAIIRLERSPYAALVAKGEPHWGIVHQDR